MRSPYSAALAALVTLAGCTASNPDVASARAPVDAGAAVESAPRARPATPLGDVMGLVLDLGAGRGCDGLLGRMMTIHGDDGGGPDVGRIWINGCESRRDGDTVVLELSAWAWTWVDESTDTAGATFELQQYVYLEAETSLRVTPVLDYLREDGQALLWARPDHPPRVRAGALGHVQPDPEGVWSELVGTVASIFGRSPDEHARSRVGQTGRRRFEDMLHDGFTVFVDLCTGVTGMEIGHLTEYPYPRRRPDEPGPVTRIRLRPGGLDVHGPLRRNGEAVEVHLETDRAPVRARLMCGTETDAFIRATVASGDRPEGALAQGRATPDAPLALAVAEGDACPLYLVTTPESGTTNIAFTFHTPGAHADAMVPGCE